MSKEYRAALNNVRYYVDAIARSESHRNRDEFRRIAADYAVIALALKPQDTDAKS